ncbi:NAD(P)-binding domain-containing protein [Egicoccus halophilus]|uniref:Oxidoreductase n=1 Tax=Egicoccus halophilus TaxID=1670830 RepID=A0A8J3ETB4_9ACTN|nr:NAD(P)-binding domain-containing protein [Egicoccus halophilus]GGI03586.1 oxidoreductase [Egicoccus halophilus]
MRDVEVVVVGAGQAGLSAAHFLGARGFSPGDEFVLLDADDGPGGAWRHRWPTLTMRAVHGVHDLPGLPLGEVGDDEPASEVMADYFARYERTFDLPVHRPVAVRAVREVQAPDDGRLVVETDGGTWRTRALINATGTWTRPFWPGYPGRERFRGEQLHTADYAGPHAFAGRHVVVVGGGHSAVQHLAEISRVTTTTWVTRREPVWRDTPFDHDAGREAIAKVKRAVAEGRRPASVVRVTGLVATPPVEEARRRGALERSPMFDRITPDGVAWDDGRSVRAGVILWATGFRHALDHLAPLDLRDASGGIRMEGTHVADDPRLHLLGYGPSASTIGANRAARIAVRDLRSDLGRTAA